ncbi:MAG: hypothetical protein KDC95_14670 [Planctomycetes bacterium]|nr:hypothetical protein [Planctomycetota bacterium]
MSGRFKLSIVNTDEAQSFVDVDVVDHAGVMTAREDGSFTFQMSDVERARLVVRHPDLGSVERTIEFTKAHDAEVVLDVPDPLRTPR